MQWMFHLSPWKHSLAKYYYRYYTLSLSLSKLCQNHERCERLYGLLERIIKKINSKDGVKSVNQSSINISCLSLIRLFSWQIGPFLTFFDAIFSCAVDGGWSNFGYWSACSARCGGGIQKRRRTCTNPPPSNGGKCCNGDNLEVKLCNTKPCGKKGE